MDNCPTNSALGTDPDLLRRVRICICGTGGARGYFGVGLATAGDDAVFIARGAHLTAMCERGHRLVAPIDDLTIHPDRAVDDPTNVFVHFGPVPGNVLVSRKPIQDDRAAISDRIDGECVHVEGWPVRPLPPERPPTEEAIADAIRTELDGVPAGVFSVEHLTAIALIVGRRMSATCGSRMTRDTEPNSARSQEAPSVGC